VNYLHKGTEAEAVRHELHKFLNNSIVSIMANPEVRERIEAAFADTPAPGEAFEDISATEWDEGIVEYFRGTTWRGHHVQDLRCHYAALSFFTPKAFRYWLPAFMLAELDHPEEADVISECIASNFTRSEGDDEKLREFTRDELEAIATFFDECARRYCNGVHDRKFRKAESAVRARLVRGLPDQQRLDSS
jgi:hypothetical protein